jgi:hypothetical protein
MVTWPPASGLQVHISCSSQAVAASSSTPTSTPSAPTSTPTGRPGVQRGLIFLNPTPTLRVAADPRRSGAVRSQIGGGGKSTRGGGAAEAEQRLQGMGVLMRSHFPGELSLSLSLSLSRLQFLHKICTVIFLFSPNLLEILMPRLTESTSCDSPLFLMFLCSSQIVYVD